MRSSPARGATAAIAVLALPLVLCSAAFARTTRITLHGAKAAFCTDNAVSGDWATRRSFTAPVDGVVTATLNGPAGADWDIALLDRASGSRITAGGDLDADEIAQAYVGKDQRILVQVCRRSGSGRTGELEIAFSALKPVADDAYKLKLVRVNLHGGVDAAQLAALGLDTSDHPMGRYWDVFLHSAADERALQQAGFTYQVREADVLASDAADRKVEAAAAADPAARAAADAAVPSGRTSYRDLEQINREMRDLAARYPTLVRVFALPVKSWQGREIMGMEIAENVTAPPDGRPVYVQVGTHHAREWPANEATLEFGIELIRNYVGDLYRPVDPRLTQIVKEARTYIIPVQNVDGFNVTIEAERAANGNFTDPNDSSATGPSGNQAVGSGAYKRKNCRPPANPALAATPCLLLSAPPTGRDRGVDTNRNYGASWGGPGASNTETSLTYHGPAPFSEPETEAMRQFLRNLQPNVLITNHTFSGLLLRPPGVNTFGPVPDEDRLRALGDAMARQTAYISEYSYQLYDTTGTTDDYIYDALGGFSFTPEIGKSEFHPAYTTGFIPEYNGQPETDIDGNPTGRTLGGLREAYTIAGLAAIDRAPDGSPLANNNDSIIRGSAVPGRTLHIRKDIFYTTSGLPDDSGVTFPQQTLREPRDSSLVVPAGGAFVWHVNPSRQPRNPDPVPWLLTCEDGAGNVLESRNIYVERGQEVNVGLTCAAQTSPSTPAPTQPAPSSAGTCKLPNGFSAVNATRSGSGLHLTFTQTPGSAPVNIDIFQTSRGHKVIAARAVARFTGRTAGFTWNGRATGGKRLSDGVYYVRFRTLDPQHRIDSRRVVVERRHARFAKRGAFYLADSCA